MRVLGIIPARLGSTRLKNKMLLEIAGKPLVYHTWKAVLKAKTLDALVIATDAKEIKDVCEGFGAKVIMTSEKIQSGSDRVAKAASLYTFFKPDIVVNIQGDEPLIPHKAIDGAVNVLKKNKDAMVATPATIFPKGQDIDSPNFVKVVKDKNGKALYFSRSRMPYPRDEYSGYLKHLGLYAYRYDFLQKYTKMKPTPLEQAEKLEQLRILENGYNIYLSVGNYPTTEVNTLEEFMVVKEIMEPSVSSQRKLGSM